MAAISRATFILRWLDARGLLARHDDLAPEDVLVREGLVVTGDEASGFDMRRVVGLEDSAQMHVEEVP